MRISDWSSDVCSSDLRAADAHHDCPGPHLDREREGDRPIVRNDIVTQRRGIALPLEGLHDVAHGDDGLAARLGPRSEEHTSELQSLMRISYAVFCLKKKKTNH